MNEVLGRPSMVTHTRNLFSAFKPSKLLGAVSSEHTHTLNTHPEQWAAIFAVAPREQLGVGCLVQGQLSHGYWRWKRELVIHSPHLYFLSVLRIEPRNWVGLGIENQFQFQNRILMVRNRIHVVKFQFQFHLSIPVCASFFFLGGVKRGC